MKNSERSGLGPIVLATWLGIGALLIFKTVGAGGLMLSTDDAMRLVQVRDLLNGQSWFDTTQWRMNAPYGLPMHWSHLVDACIAGLILFFRLVANPKTAEAWALYVWPLIPLSAVLFALTHIAFRLAGRSGALLALILGASCVAAMTPFRPGNIDHHNVQLALNLCFVASLIDMQRSRWPAVCAALLACISLAVGLETLPYILVGLAALALWWIVDRQISIAIMPFGLTFAAAGVFLWSGAIASTYRFSAGCDTFSGFYAAMVIISGIGMAAIAKMQLLSTPLRRGAAAASLCAVMFAVAWLIAPDCLHGPYAAVDPRLGAIWMSRVAEDQSPFTMGRMAPGDFIAGYFYCMLAMLASIAAVFIVERQHRRAMSIVCVFAMFAFAIASVELRGLSFALLFATPGVAVVLTRALSWKKFSKAAGVLATFTGVLISSNASYALVGSQIQKSLPVKQQFSAVQKQWMSACLAPAALDELATLPRGRVAAIVDQGPMILAYTHHSTLAGPYHRNSAGILDTHAIFAGSAETQREVLRRRQVAYVLVCPPAPDYRDWSAKSGARFFAEAIRPAQIGALARAAGDEAKSW